MKKTRLIQFGLGTAAMSMLVSACSFSATASGGTQKNIVGREKIVITANRPTPTKTSAPVARKAKLMGRKIEITEKIMFDTAQATIKSESHSLLQDVAQVIKENGQIKRIRIEGHTDADGSDTYNRKLSHNRAESVKNFLLKFNIDPSRIEVVGFGEDKPIAENNTNEGKEKNRRVEFKIIHQDI